MNVGYCNVNYRKLIPAILFLSVVACSLFKGGLFKKPVEVIHVIPILGHLDYGFTATQREVRAKWPEIYRDGIKFMIKHPQARLVSGCVAPIEWFRMEANDREWENFKQLLMSGRWEITAGFVHANTGVFSENEAARLFFESRKLADEIGVEIDSWLHADVPGLTWNMAEAATDAKIKIIAVGANEMNGLSPLPQGLPPLFNWEAPDGERVVVSLHGGAGYMQGGLDLVLHEPEGLESRVSEFSETLRRNGYEPNVAMALFSTGDNNGPEVLTKLIATVENYNADNPRTKLRISTIREFYDDLIESAGEGDGLILESLPSVSGDWPAAGHWEALVRRAPHAEAAARNAKRKLKSAQLLSVIARNPRYMRDIKKAWKNVLLYDEHSGVGAWPGKLTKKQVVEQNETEVDLALEALSEAERVIADLVSSKFFYYNLMVNGKPVMVCNPSGRNRSGVIELNRQTDGLDRNILPHGMSGWSCGIVNDSRIKKIRPSVKVGDCGAVLENTVYLEPPLFMEMQGMRVGKGNGMRHKSLYYEPAKGSGIVTLKWGPASKLTPAPKMRGWAATFSFKGMVGARKWVRGGLSLSESNTLGKSLSWRMPGDGIVVEDADGGGRTAIGCLDGMPVFTSVPADGKNKNWWLMYVQEQQIEFKDGTVGVVPNEPQFFDRPVESTWIMKKINSDKNDFDALGDVASPLMGHFYKEARAGERGRHSIGESIFHTFSTPAQNVVIEQVKWADFGDGIIVRVRNISGQNVKTNLVSHIGKIVKAHVTDGIERDIREAEHGEGWVRVSLKPLEVLNYRIVTDQVIMLTP